MNNLLKLYVVKTAFVLLFSVCCVGSIKAEVTFLPDDATSDKVVIPYNEKFDSNGKPVKSNQPICKDIGSKKCFANRIDAIAACSSTVSGSSYKKVNTECYEVKDGCYCLKH